MDHLDPILAVLTRRIPILVMHIGLASRRMLSGGRQDHLLIIVHGINPLAFTREGERVPELLATALVRLVGVVSVTGHGVGEFIGGAAAKGRNVTVSTASNAADDGVDHGDVSDDDGDEGFSAGPATGLLGAIGTGLVCQYTKSKGSRGEETYSYNQNTAQNTSRHNEETTAEEDEEFTLFPPGETGFEEHRSRNGNEV